MARQSEPPVVGFIGAGKMATALARGLAAAGFTTPARIIACDVLPAAREAFARETGGRTVDSVAAVTAESDVVVLAVKPQHMADVLAELRAAQPGLQRRQLVVSIAAGVPLGTLESGLPDGCRVVRVMPNTPCLVGAGASAFAAGSHATPEDARLVEQLLSTVGLAVEVPEGMLDAVTGLSGSGPAYVCQFIEALADGGVRVGLPRDVATRLAAQTVLGSAKLLLETGEHPAALKDAVASPGGTTIAGLHALERGGVRASVMDAVVAAAARSAELGRSS